MLSTYPSVSRLTQDNYCSYDLPCIYLYAGDRMKYMLLSVLFFFSLQLFGAQWTVVIYMEAEDFAAMPLKHINDMLSASKYFSDKQVTVIIQVHATGSCAWRYALEKGKLQYLEECTLSLNSAHDMQEYVLWAFKQYPAQYTMLIVSGHGYGILEPQWDKQHERWSLPYQETYESISESPSFFIDLIDHEMHKGILSRKVPQGYVSLQELECILKKVTSLLGRPLDIIGMDACSMGMLEIAYALSSYTHYYIASQECEDREGWNYKGVVEALCEHKEPFCVAQSIVAAYGRYCKQKGYTRYTLAAIDVSYMKRIKEQIDMLILLIEKCRQRYKEVFEAVLIRARRSGPHFCSAPYYKDIYAFYESLLACIESLEYSCEKEKLEQQLRKGLVVFNEATVAQVASSQLQKAHGLSVYFPRVYNASYKRARYAQESSWNQFIESLHDLK
jgi:hypothetical protein